MFEKPEPPAVPAPNVDAAAVAIAIPREIYIARPFVIYHDEIERCYNWFVERCQTAIRHRG